MLKANSAVSVSHHIEFLFLEPRASSSDHTDSDLTINIRYEISGIFS